MKHIEPRTPFGLVGHVTQSHRFFAFGDHIGSRRIDVPPRQWRCIVDLFAEQRVHRNFCGTADSVKQRHLQTCTQGIVPHDVDRAAADHTWNCFIRSCSPGVEQQCFTGSRNAAFESHIADLRITPMRNLAIHIAARSWTKLQLDRGAFDIRDLKMLLRRHRTHCAKCAAAKSRERQ